jgi:hypothetical protein
MKRWIFGIALLVCRISFAESGAEESLLLSPPSLGLSQFCPEATLLEQKRRFIRAEQGYAACLDRARATGDLALQGEIVSRRLETQRVVLASWAANNRAEQISAGLLLGLGASAAGIGGYLVSSGSGNLGFVSDGGSGNVRWWGGFFLTIAGSGAVAAGIWLIADSLYRRHKMRTKRAEWGLTW